MKRIFLAVALIVFSCSANAASIDAKITAQVEQYLNKLSSLEANFTQIDHYGNVSGGKFYLQKPGKFKWQYSGEQNIEIISNGKTLVYYDKDLGEPTYISAEDTLAGFLARKEIALKGDIKVLEAVTDTNLLKLTLTQTKKPEEGKLTVYINPKPMILSKLEVTDANGSVTQVFLDNQKTDVKLDDKLFKFVNPRYNKNAWE